MKKRLDSVAKVGIYFFGILSFTYGVHQIYRPAGFIVAGILCVALSLVLDKSSDQ